MVGAGKRKVRFGLFFCDEVNEEAWKNSFVYYIRLDLSNLK